MSNPWPDVATARSYLNRLTSGAPQSQEALPVNVEALAAWLVDQGLGPLAFARAQDSFPALAAHLESDAYSVFAENSMHFHRLQQIGASFRQAAVPLVLLKGAALAQFAYGSLGRRRMTDLDIWVKGEQIPAAVALMKELGFQARQKDRRPLALQELSRGEIQFYGPYEGLVELHWSPFPGWWLKRVAAVDDAAIWSRIEPLPLPQAMPSSPGASGDGDPADTATSASPFYHLAAEDAVIHVAVHTAVNHQFGKVAIRGLMDIALTARARPVDWHLVAHRAREWRLGVTVWLVLDLARQLLGLEDVEAALPELQPSRLRRRLLHRFVSPEKLLAGIDHRASSARFLLLLLLVDRPRDMLRLLYRTLWPESEWIQARYLGRRGRLGHIWSILRHGQV